MSSPAMITEQERVQSAKEHFAACLIISSASFMLFGYNVSSFVRYVSRFWKRDGILVRSWVIITMISNTVSVLYGGVYADWLLSIDSWSSKFAHQNDVAGGVSSILYAINLTLVQIFWCGCIFKMMASRPKLRLACVALIALTSLGSVSIAFSLGVILLNQSSDGISAAHSRLSRAIDSLTLLADLMILATVITKMLSIKKSSRKMRRVVSRLSYIFAAVTFISSLILICEIIVIYPSTTQSRYIVDFTYLYTPIYTGSMLAILKARTKLYLQNNPSTDQDQDGPDFASAFESDRREYDWEEMGYRRHSTSEITNTREFHGVDTGSRDTQSAP